MQIPCFEDENGTRLVFYMDSKSKIVTVSIETELNSIQTTLSYEDAQSIKQELYKWSTAIQALES